MSGNEMNPGPGEVSARREFILTDGQKFYAENQTGNRGQWCVLGQNRELIAYNLYREEAEFIASRLNAGCTLMRLKEMVRNLV